MMSSRRSRWPQIRWFSTSCLQLQLQPPLPIQLACPILGTFLDNIRSGGLPSPIKNDFVHFRKLVAACSSFYDEESQLRESLRQVWTDYLLVSVVDEMFTGSANLQGVSRTDLGIRDGVYDALVWLTEVKRGLNYKLNWFSARVREKKICSDSYCPVLILQHIGQLLHVGAAVLLPSSTPGKDDKVLYQPLTCVDLVPIHAHDLDMSLQGVRVCMAIKAAVHDLLKLYDETGRLKARILNSGLSARNGFQRISRRSRCKLVNSSITSLCMASGGLQKRGVILSSIAMEVHRAWAAAGFAPKLMRVTTHVGVWIEVRMAGRMLYELKEKEADRLRSRVLKALVAAHNVQVGVSSGGEPMFGDAGYQCDGEDRRRRG